VDLGDFSAPIAFGASGLCPSETRLNAERFILLSNDQSVYEGRNYSFYEYDGDLQEGTEPLIFTMIHKYQQPGVYQVSSFSNAIA